MLLNFFKNQKIAWLATDTWVLIAPASMKWETSLKTVLQSPILFQITVKTHGLNMHVNIEAHHACKHDDHMSKKLSLIKVNSHLAESITTLCCVSESLQLSRKLRGILAFKVDERDSHYSRPILSY